MKQKRSQRPVPGDARNRAYDDKIIADQSFRHCDQEDQVRNFAFATPGNSRLAAANRETNLVDEFSPRVRKRDSVGGIS